MMKTMDMYEFDLDALVRPSVRRLAPYRCARHSHDQGILLDANENPYPTATCSDGTPLNRYPDPLQRRLRARLASLAGVRAESVFVGSGSDEVIDLLMRVFCEPGRDEIVVCEPTYGMYRVAAAINDVAVCTVPLTRSFNLDTLALERALASRPKLLFCCSPNNPTGNLLKRETIAALCRNASSIVVVDEAYVEFAGNGSVAALVEQVPNLVVMRTMSKAWGCAGIRVGYALAQPALIEWLVKIKPPYNVGSLAASAALDALSAEREMRRAVERVITERARLRGALRRSPMVEHVFPSDANFLLVRFTDASRLQRRLAERGVVVRDRSDVPGLDGCLRITVGAPEENDRLLELLDEFTEPRSVAA